MEIQPRSEQLESEIKDYLSKDRSSLATEDLGIDPPKDKKKKLVSIILALVLLVLAFAYTSYEKGHGSFTMEKVSVSIDSSEAIDSGVDTDLTIVCNNSNKVAVENAKLQIFFPDDFLFKSSDQTINQSGSAYYWDIGSIPAQGTKKVRIYGKVIGKLGEERTFTAKLSYEPSNFSSVFNSEGSKTVKIGSVPVDIGLDFPDSIMDSKESELTFSYKNRSQRDFEKARIEIDFPLNFIVTSSTPTVVKENGANNTYAFEDGAFNKGAATTVKVTGKFQSQSEQETVKARVSLLEDNKQFVEYAEAEKAIKMGKTDILLSQTVDGASDYVANKNDTLTYRITFKNQSSRDLQGLVLKSNLSGILDMSSIKADKGTVKDGQIIWSAVNVPELGHLAKDAEGSVEFTAKVLDKVDIKSDQNKNYIIKNNAAISSFSSGGAQTGEKTLAENELDTKVRSFLYLDTRGYFNDDGRLENTGALPPRVGSSTQYTIHWSIRNYFNDTENIKIYSVLPRGVKWTGKYIDSKGNSQSVGAQSTASMTADDAKITEEKIFYDDDKNSVVWEIPSMKANEGILTPAKEIVFQIEVRPEEQDISTTMQILESATVSGTDTFTQTKVTGSGAALTTDLTSTDFSISDSEAIVKKQPMTP
jgi:hypothetical protein